MLALLLQILAPFMPVDTLRIGVVGDSQQQPTVFGAICQSLAQERIDLFVGLGDHVQNHGQPGEWQTLWTLPRAPIASIPVLGAIGNHDDILGYSANVWQIPQHPVTSIYGNAIACWGAVTVGQVRFVFLDSNEEPAIRLSLEAGGSQRAWLLSELAGRAWQDARWRVACWHHPATTEMWDGGCYYPPAQALVWTMEAVAMARASLVLNGHAHAYQRGQWRGTNWVISGGGGGWLDTTRCRDLPEITVATAQHHYLTIDATPDALTVTARTPDGRTVIDSLVIR